MSKPLVPLVHFPWTGPDGTVHEREPGADHTLCGVACEGPSHTYAAKIGCDVCVKTATVEWAKRHTCAEECRVHYEQDLPALDQRIPQASKGAQLDRTLSMSGRIIPPAEPCTDVDLIARVDEGLRRI